MLGTDYSGDEDFAHRAHILEMERREINKSASNKMPRGNSVPRKHTAGFRAERIVGRAAKGSSQSGGQGGLSRKGLGAESGGRNTRWGGGDVGQVDRPQEAPAMGLVPPMASMTAEGPGHAL